MTVGVYAIGDSVMQGAGPELYATLPACMPGIEVDAAPSRQLKHAPPIIRARLAHGPRPVALVVHLGTNGLFADATFDDLVGAADPVSTLVIVTVKTPREWEAAVNERLTRGVDRWSRTASLLDWWSIATRSPQHLRPDGFHLSATGSIAYAVAITDAVRPAN